MNDKWINLLLKSELKNGVYYYGECRNANVARWDEHNGEFIYWRYKFGDKYTETIKHFQDDDGYDLFYPTKEVDWGVDHIPLNSDDT